MFVDCENEELFLHNKIFSHADQQEAFMLFSMLCSTVQALALQMWADHSTPITSLVLYTVWCRPQQGLVEVKPRPTFSRGLLTGVSELINSIHTSPIEAHLIMAYECSCMELCSCVYARFFSLFLWDIVSELEASHLFKVDILWSALTKLTGSNLLLF